jgi:nucleoside-diphosphate-sugar epimerase
VGEQGGLPVTHYLITGGAGFIGSNLVETLVGQGQQVRVLDNFSTGKRENLAAFEDKVEVIEGDITHVEDVEAAMRGIQVVFHQAAVPSVPKSIQDPLGSNRASVDGTLHVLLAARDAGVGRVIFASSSSIYGDQEPDLAKVETMTPQPISPYGVAKLAAERYCQVFYKVYGLETVCLRYFNVFGPRQDPQSMYAAVIPRFVTALLAGLPPPIYGSGQQTRDFTYIGNVVAGNLLAAGAPAKRVAGETFNLAAGGQTSLNTLVEMLQEIIGINLGAAYEPARPGDILHSRADISKAEQGMGYRPGVSLLDGLRHTVAWYRQQA